MQLKLYEFSKTKAILLFLKKIIDFFSRKNMNLFKIGEGGKFAVESVSKKKNFQNCIFHFNCEVVFLQLKSENF